MVATAEDRMEARRVRNARLGRHERNRAGTGDKTAGERVALGVRQGARPGPSPVFRLIIAGGGSAVLAGCTGTESPVQTPQPTSSPADSEPAAR